MLIAAAQTIQPWMLWALGILIATLIGLCGYMLKAWKERKDKRQDEHDQEDKQIRQCLSDLTVALVRIEERQVSQGEKIDKLPCLKPGGNNIPPGTKATPSCPVEQRE